MNPPDQRSTSPDESIESIQEALNHLLNEIAPTLSKKSEPMAAEPRSRIHHCIKLIKSEASLAASLIADCAPQGRPMLAQAQQTLKNLESLQLLAQESMKESSG